MTYEKEHSYLSRLAEKAKKGIGILTLTALSYAGLDALLETISPSAKSAQAQEQKDKTLIEKIKEYTAAIKNYEAKGDKANADAQRKLLNQEFLKAPKSLNEYLDALRSSQENITPETLLKAAKNAEPGILVATDKNASARAIESLYRMLILKSGQTTTKNTLFEFLLVEWQYSNMLADKGMAKYKSDVSKAKSGLTQAYSSMTAEEQAEAKKTANAYGLEFLVPTVPPAKPAPAPEVKPEPKPQPAAQPKPQPKTEPKKPKPAPAPSTIKPAQQQPRPTKSQPNQQPEESDRPSYIEIGTAINSNRSTQGNKQRASLISDALELRGLYDFLEWRNPQDEMTTRATTAGAAEIKPLVITKIADLLGAEIPKELVDFLTVGVAGESQSTTRRKFEQTVTEDSDFRITSDTTVKEKFTDSMISANATLRLLFLELCAAGNARPQVLTTEVDNAIYIINKKDPAGNHSMSSRTELENLINEQRVQGEIKYVFETMLGEKIPFTGKIGILADYAKTKQELADRTDQDTQSTLFGLTAEGKISDAFAFNIIAAQELFNGPGEKNDGWKDTRLYGSLLLKAEGDTVKNIHAQKMYTAKAAAMLAGWLKEKNWAVGGGLILGTGEIDTDYINEMLGDMGKTELGLRMDLGETLAGMETSRQMRIIPRALKKGINVFAFGGARTVRDPRNKKAFGAFGYAAVTAGPLSIAGRYDEDWTIREIGGYFGADFDVMRLLIGFVNREDRRQQHSSKTGEAIIEIPLG